MISNKIFACMILCSVLSAGLVFGGGNKDTAASGKITINVLDYDDTTNSNAQGINQVIWEGFQKANPDIILVRETSMNEQYHNKVEAYVAAGKVPDVLYAWPRGRSTALQQNHLIRDLLPLIRKDGMTRDFIPQALDPAEQGAGYVAELARNINITHMFMVNLEVLEACGLTPAKTYSELKAQVPVLRAKGYDTVIMPNQDAWTMQSVFFSMVAGRFCGPDWAQRIHDGKAKFTDPDFVKALTFVKTVFDDNVISKSTLGVAYGEAPGLFGNRRGAYYIDGAWRIGAFVTDKSTGQGLFSLDRQKKVLVTIFPDIEGAKINNSTSVQLGSGYAISSAIPAGSPKEEAAWRLVKWLSSREIASYLVEIGSFAIPARTDIDVSSLKLEPLQQAAGQLSSQYTTGTPVVDDAFESEVHVEVNNGLQQIAAGDRTPEQVAQTIQRAFDSWKAAKR